MYKDYTAKFKYPEISKEELEKKLKSIGCCNVEITKKSEKRTLSQNSGLHLYENWFVIHCNNLGLPMTILYENPSEIPVTKENIHLYVKKINKSVNGIEETSKLNKVQFTQLIEALKIDFSQKADFQAKFPSIDNQYYNNLC